MPGIVANLVDSLFTRSEMRAGRDDLGSPFERAAEAILFGRRWEMREWKIALSARLVSHVILDERVVMLDLHKAAATVTPRDLIAAIRPLAIALKKSCLGTIQMGILFG